MTSPFAISPTVPLEYLFQTSQQAEIHVRPATRTQIG